MAILDATDCTPLTFLYKLCSGRSSKSHGFNAAEAAGIDKKLVQDARDMAKNYEERNVILKEFKSILLHQISRSFIW